MTRLCDFKTDALRFQQPKKYKYYLGVPKPVQVSVTGRRVPPIRNTAEGSGKVQYDAAFGTVQVRREAQPKENLHKCGTLVLGGGPGGYAAASMLEQQGHHDVVILERNESAEWHDTSKAYSYSLDFRGRSLLASLGITTLEEKDLLAPKIVTYINLDGSTEDRPFFGSLTPEQAKKPFAGYTWLSRHALLQTLHKHLQEKHPGVRIQFKTRATRVSLPNAGNSFQLMVEAQADGKTQWWAPKLLVATDGMNAIVRQAIEEAEPGSVKTVKAHSDSAGLAFKILALPHSPRLKRGSDHGYANNVAVVLPGKDLGEGPPLRIGMLPNRDMSDKRSANLVFPQSHKLWTIKTVDELYDYLERSFPQMDVRRVVGKEEAERFVSRAPGKFPEPQYCTSLVKCFPEASSPEVDAQDALSSTPGCALVLLGDAAHSFPPDLGQGVNSALQDVAVLRQCLQECGGDYHRGLQLYQATRLPEIKALVRMMQIGAPYQYRQADKKLQIVLWTINFSVRLVLNKLFPTVFDKHFFPSLDKSPNYTAILNAYDTTTRRIQMLLGGACVVLAAVAAKMTVLA